MRRAKRAGGGGEPKRVVRKVQRKEAPIGRPNIEKRKEDVVREGIRQRPGPDSRQLSKPDSRQDSHRRPRPPRQDSPEDSQPAPSPRLRPPRPRSLAPKGPPDGAYPTPTSASSIVQAEITKYKAYFPTLEEVVTLTYPTGKEESFLLLTPRSANEYVPLEEVLATVRVVVDHLVPDQHRHLFRTGGEGPPLTPSIVRRLERAKNIKDGDLFSRALVDYNAALGELARSGQLSAHVDGMTELPLSLSRLVQLQVHNRVVGPAADQLNKYTPWTDNVYGELTTKFMDKLFRHLAQSEVDPLDGDDRLFLDLGCGTGNCVVQAVLQKGCRAVGVEMMPVPAGLGQRQAVELEARTRGFFGLEIPHPEIIQGDFLRDKRVECANLVSSADVILINNYAFSPETNEGIKTLLYEAKEGSWVVSLKPLFQPRTVGTIDAAFRVEPRDYHSGDVSWTDQGGMYYLARRRASGKGVDRRV